MPESIVREMVHEADEEMRKGHFSRALLHYENVLAHDAETTAAKIGKAASLLSMGEVEEGGRLLAAIDPDSIVELDDRTSHSFWTADWQARKGDTADALATIDRALEAYPPDRFAGRFQVMAARTLIQKGDRDAAKARTRSASASLRSMRPEDTLWLANVSLLCGDNETGMLAARSALKHRPSGGAIYMAGFSGLGRLGFLPKLLLAGGVLALLLVPPGGWIILLLILGVLAIGAVVGWRRRLGAVMLGSVFYSGVIILAGTLVWVWMQISLAR